MKKGMGNENLLVQRKKLIQKELLLRTLANLRNYKRT